MPGLFGSREQYLNIIDQSTVFYALAAIFLVAGFLFVPCLLISLVFAVVGLTSAWARKPLKRTPEVPWLSSPGAWCPTCGGPAMWMPKDARWFCNSCSQYLPTAIAPAGAPLPPPR